MAGRHKSSNEDNILKKNVHKPDWQDYFLYVFRTINTEHNTKWLSIRLSLVLRLYFDFKSFHNCTFFRTIYLYLKLSFQVVLCEEGFLVRYVRYAYSMLDVRRTDTKI